MPRSCCYFRFVFGTTCCEGESKCKCGIDGLSCCICWLLSVSQANTTNCKYCRIRFSMTNNSGRWRKVRILISYWFLVCLCDCLMQETMSNEHAMRFPLVGSAMLLSLFLLFKFFSKDLVNAVLTCYFFLLGILAFSYVFFLCICTFCSV